MINIEVNHLEEKKDETEAMRSNSENVFLLNE